MEVLRFTFKIVVRLLLCMAGTWYLSRQHGLAFGIVFSAPLYGIAFARPLIDIFFAAPHEAKKHALKDIQGRNYEHRGYRIDIVEDDEDWRWLRMADVRKVLPGLPGDRGLKLQWQDRFEEAEGRAPARIRADALRELLAKSHDANGLKFKVWLERDVIYPSGKGEVATPRSPA